MIIEFTKVREQDTKTPCLWIRKDCESIHETNVRLLECYRGPTRR